MLNFHFRHCEYTLCIYSSITKSSVIKSDLASAAALKTPVSFVNYSFCANQANHFKNCNLLFSNKLINWHLDIATRQLHSKQIMRSKGVYKRRETTAHMGSAWNKLMAISVFQLTTYRI